MNKSASVKSAREKGLVLCALRGFLTAVLALLLLAAAFSAFGLTMKNPGEYTKIFAFASLFGGAFSGGFAAARKKGCSTLPCGALTGAFILAAMALCALCFSLPLNISLFAVCSPSVLLCSVLGANIGVGFQSAAKAKRKR